MSHRTAWVIAVAYVVLELAVSDRYGFQQDELYFLVASHHLAFGYVDQPPLAVLLARATDLFGVNPAAIRILPALADGATSCSPRGSRSSAGTAPRG